ncbi:MAG: KpsF/GutQ family sugar-phosphate isomerase [Nitrospinaceae bacterium]|nr:KpsF/GutQ family sugar-phosphate isomerase [Nitrospinaceae bacterium]NIR56911.1 KpsF/GutQ family sugar-phosphate isomerase [Nitrospinaceae bacterium]NIS87373.1 KpsF/GutQ family sugar-phosphate isomerase [Nitrospinaceae bacterium]NIT84228.1 KpsF/GutQ family sugar-phosphate isomerase [Nitrospinaceae bacterium]NIU46413.1 KpsF/GutQ family sugar-phosphate isomerase [Nitrospinaceae bacterium]
MQPLKKSSAISPELQAKIIEAGKRVLRIESESISDLIPRIDQTFVDVVALLDDCPGHLVVMGIGKSGLVGQKIAATFSSIGLPAVFLHAAEASHGDLGIIGKEDIILAISNSGETEEMVKLLPVINRRKCTLVAMTGKADSTLAKRAHYVLNIGVKEEACPVNLVPTASTTATIAMGDTLAMGLLEKRGFKPESFALNHPGGSLGRKLLVTVEDLTHAGDTIPTVRESADIYAVLTEMSRKRLGCTLVVDAAGVMRGIITDGDLRRLMESKRDISTIKAADLMSANPKTVQKDDMATKALQIMEEYSITCLVVSDDGKQIDGMVHLHDLLRSGIA